MSSSARRLPRQSAWRIFRIPIAIAIASLVGLLAGLTGDGWRDIAAWALLSIPILACLSAWRRRT